MSMMMPNVMGMRGPALSKDYTSIIEDGAFHSDVTVTFARNSVATYFDSAGVMQEAAIDTPRVDYDPADGTLKGYLVEEARTNLLTYSEQFDDAAWFLTEATITANQAVAPDGTTTADLFTPTVVSSVHRGYTAAKSVLDATVYTQSIYIKSAGYTKVMLREAQVTGDYASFELSGTGTVLEEDSGVTGTITALSDDWYRITMASTTGGTGERFSVYVLDEAYTSGDPSFTAWTANGTSGVYIWGAQLEEGAFPTSYIKTEAATVTREADAGSITGSDFTDFYDVLTPGHSLYVNCASAGGVPVCANDGTDTNRAFIYADSAYQGLITDDGVAQAVLDNGSVTANTFIKVALGYQADNAALSLDGATAATDTSVTLPEIDSLFVGSRTAAAGHLNGHIKTLRYYAKRLPDSVLEDLTS